jgi:hypothetical protein
MLNHAVVIAGLDPAIHPFRKKMDPRVKPAGDGESGSNRSESVLEPTALRSRLVGAGLKPAPTMPATGSP